MTALMARTADPDTDRWRGTGFLSQVQVFTGRALRPLLCSIHSLAFVLAQPLVLLLIFSQVFAGMAHAPGFPPGISYLDFLVPAIMVNVAISVAIRAGAGMVEDMRNGLITRLRALPINPLSLLFARSIADLVNVVLQLSVIVVLAPLTLGFAPAGGIEGVMSCLVVVSFFGWSLTWVFIGLAIWLRAADQLQVISFVVMVPLMFGSTAFSPMQGLPLWLRVFAEINPMSHAIDAARGLVLASPSVPTVLVSLATGGVLMLIGMLVSVLAFRRK